MRPSSSVRQKYSQVKSRLSSTNRIAVCPLRLAYNLYPANYCSQAGISWSYFNWETGVNSFLPSDTKLCGRVLKPLYQIAAGCVVNASSPRCRQTCCKHSVCPCQMVWTRCVTCMQMWKGEPMRLNWRTPIWRLPKVPVLQQPQGKGKYKWMTEGIGNCFYPVVILNFYLKLNVFSLSINAIHQAIEMLLLLPCDMHLEKPSVWRCAIFSFQANQCRPSFFRKVGTGNLEKQSRF